jgi:LmbE family N-acetylglucosaminyl deacetylase
MRFNQFAKTEQSRVQVVLRTVFGVLMTGAVIYILVTQVGTRSLFSMMQPFPLDGHQRLLVFAPHEDDETLGPGGLILAARRSGMQVRVVVETNGDGNLFATMQDFKRLFPSAKDYIHMGNLRQKETLAAMKVLGVDSSDVTFLSYPDRGTPALWSGHWSTFYTSPYTQDNHSAYEITYDPNAHYTGADLLGDLKEIIENDRPDLIVYPHPEDVHPDHWGLSAFTHLAITLARRDLPGYQPDAFVYLVHRPDFPMPKGLYPNDDLQPPSPLMRVNSQWYRLDLSPEDENTKEKAILEYRSQRTTMPELLDSFDRVNELFGVDPDGTLPVLIQAQADDPSTWQGQDGLAVAPIQVDPVRDFPTRDLVPASDIVALYAGWWQDELLMCLQVRGKASDDMRYHIHGKSIGPDGVIDFQASNQTKTDPLRASLNGRYICTQVGKAELKNPEYVYVGANVSTLISEDMDQIAWKMLKVGLSGMDAH